MYYSHPCPYCSKIFYVFGDSKENASETLYAGIKKHQTDYNEDWKEHSMDESPEKEANDIYSQITESSEVPPGGYALE